MMCSHRCARLCQATEAAAVLTCSVWRGPHGVMMLTRGATIVSTTDGVALRLRYAGSTPDGQGFLVVSGDTSPANPRERSKPGTLALSYRSAPYRSAP